MAWAWLAAADSNALSQCEGGETVPEISPELEPVDFRILTLRFEGTRPTAILAALTLDLRELTARVERPAFQELERRVEKAMVERITGRGEFEPITAARAEAPQAMKRLISQSRLERDPKVRLAANQAVLKYGGVEPARRLEITTPDKILDQMTPAELALFAAHRQWPGRFKEALRAYLPAPARSKLPAPESVDGVVEEDSAPATVLRVSEDDIPKSTLPPVDAE